MADLRQMPEEEFMRLMRAVGPNASIPEPATTAPNVDLTTLIPATQNALRTVDLSSEEKRMGIRPGVFLNTVSGAPSRIRLKMGLDDNQLNQLKMLSQEYGPGKVDLSDDGRFIIRDQTSEGGFAEDVMVDPIGFEGGDASEIASQILPIAAGMIGARLGGRLGKGPMTKVLGAVTGMAAAQESAGFVQDAIVRGYRGDEVNADELAVKRGKMALADEIIGLGFAGGAKVMSKVIEGIAGTFQIPVGTTATKEATKKLAQQTGVKFPLTPGQESESGLLLKVEGMASQRLGTSAVFDKIQAAQQSAEGELRRVFLGLPRNLSDKELAALLPQADLVGQQGLTRLGTEALKLEGDVAKASQAVQRTGTVEAQKLAGVTLKTPISATEVGEFARTKVVGDFQKFKSDMGVRYEQFLSNPEITSRTVNGDSLARAVSSVEKRLVPAKETTKQTASPILGGQPTTTTVVEPLDSFTPGKVRGFIDELKGLKGAKVSINDLKQIRTSIDNSIAEGVAIPGTDIKQLISIKEAVNDSIESALAGAKDKSLAGTWAALNSDFAKGMSRFDKIGIRNMLIKEGERGSIGNTAISDSITENSAQALDRFNDFKTFFGAGSKEFTALKASARQNVLQGSLSDVSGYVDGALLRSRLRGMRPEVAEELFGTNKEELHRIGEALSKAQGKLDVDELGRLSESRSLTASKIPDLVAAESARATAFNNKLIRAASKGTIGAEKIQPSQFVRYATEMDPDDAAKVMGVLADQPELLHEIRQLGIEQIWARARAGVIGQEKISPKLLTEVMGGDVQKRTWKTIIGADTVDALETFIDVTSKREGATKFGRSMAGLGGQMDMTRIFLRGEVGAIPEMAARAVMGFIYSGPLKRTFTNLATSNDRSRMLNAVIASTPFIENITSRFGSDGAFLIMNSLRNAVEPMQKKAMQIQGDLKIDDPRSLNPEEFNQWMENNLRKKGL